MLRRRSSDDHENPAWPGLVDLFAFGMVLMGVLWAAAAPAADAGDSRAELEKARQRIAELESENAGLKSVVKGAEEALDRLARARAQALLDRLRAAIPSSDVRFGELLPDSPEFAIEAVGGRTPTFDKAKAILHDDDRALLVRAAELLGPHVAADPALTLVSRGTADPRPLTSPVHPRDNVELSALRAADTAKALGAGSDVMTMGKLSVVGLGEVGRLEPDVVDADAAYAKYRSVRLSLLVRKDLLRVEPTGGR